MGEPESLLVILSVLERPDDQGKSGRGGVSKIDCGE